MTDTTTFRQLALSFEKATEQPHFDKCSFRIHKKIFATLDVSNQRVVLRLSAADQSVFCLYNSRIIYPASGSWGKKGWTVIELAHIEKEVLHHALTQAYCGVAPKKLAERYSIG